MKKGWITAAIILTVTGLIIISVSLIVSGFDFSKFGSPAQEAKTYNVTEDFRDLNVCATGADIEFKPSRDGVASIEYSLREGYEISFSVDNGTLNVKTEDKRGWREYISLFSGPMSLTFYLPGEEYGNLQITSGTGKTDIPSSFKFESADITASTGNVLIKASVSGALKIKTSTGNITAEDIGAGSLDLSVSTGRVTVSSVVCGGDFSVSVNTGKTVITDASCKNFYSTGSTGKVDLKNVIASESMNIGRGTGDVRFENCDAENISVKTSTGDVSGTLCSEKIFIAKTSTGRIKVPDTSSGGRCEITTTTGDINIGISGK